MFKNERTDRIMEILKENKYTTVEKLVSELHYSPATIRRDLTYLAKIGLVRKSYGGVRIEENAKPLIVREHEMHDEKMKICKMAADLINDGDFIFIDGTTTTFFLGEFLELKKDITVMTSNLKLALLLGEKNVNCFVTGGKVVDTGMLAGTLADDAVKRLTEIDLCFFSVGSLSDDGNLGIAEHFSSMTAEAVRKAKRSVLLCDSSKMKKSYFVGAFSLSEVDTVISDTELSEDLRSKFPDTEFIISR